MAYGYVAYIDEAGDFGLRHVVPIDGTGAASEWLVLSALLIRAANEQATVETLRQLRLAAKNNQSLDLHFRTLNDRQKKIVCDGLAGMDLRLFVVISNKQNMRRHRNDLAAGVSKTRAWFYWWLCRLLLERVTEFCEHRNIREGTPGQKVRIELSRRKDLKYTELTDYLTRLWVKDQNGELVLDKRKPVWSVLDFSQIYAFDHRSRAGLQLGDVVASAFYQAVNRDGVSIPNAQYAERLRDRVWSKNGQWVDEGFTVWPTTLRFLRLDEGQKQIFRHYGYPERKL